ncbi:MAG: PspA/IM30 family protein [Granulosicoccaceae bacterium]
MNLFKRIVTTVHSGVDRTVASMENHEAIVDAALKESREAVVRAKARLTRLEKDGMQQHNRVTELSSEIELWADRAVACADTDRQKALACLQRKKLREKTLIIAREQLDEHGRIIKRVRGSIDESTNRVEALQQQRNQMRSREAAAQAGSIVYTLDGRMGDDVENAIERWEVKVGQSELLNDSHLYTDLSTDELAEGFDTNEENERLEAELDALVTQGSNSNE